jgi:Protein of unknown function (DUF2568)
MRNVNDAVRFLLELALLVAVSYVAGTVGSHTWLQIVLAAGQPASASRSRCWASSTRCSSPWWGRRPGHASSAHTGLFSSP